MSSKPAKRDLSRYRRARWLIAIAAIAILVVCGDRGGRSDGDGDGANSGADRAVSESQYRLIESELTLAKTDTTYLVVDLQHRLLRLKLRGTDIWDCAMDFADADSQDVRQFQRRFEGSAGMAVRKLTAKHLFAAEEQIPDSVLAIISEATSASPELLQRELPQRFQLRWNDGLVLEVTTNISGKPVSRIQNAVVDIRGILESPFGEATIALKMEADDALTLYRALSPGISTLIIPAQ